MRALARDGSAHPLTVEVARGILEGAGGACRLARELRGWLDRRFRFLEDPLDVEYLRHPAYQLRQIGARGVAYGDCDDAAVLGAAVGHALGLPVRYVLVALLPGATYGHVYAEVQCPCCGCWWDLDVTRPAQLPAAFRPGRVARAQA